MRTITLIITYLLGLFLGISGMLLFVRSDSYESLSRVLMGIGIVLMLSSFLVGAILLIRKYKNKISTFLD